MNSNSASSQSPNIQPQVVSATKMYQAMVGVALICGLLIVSVFILTQPFIERNEAAALDKAVFKVLPGAVTKQSFTLTTDQKFRPAKKEDTQASKIHVGFNSQNELVGIAFQAQAMGYADFIRVLCGYSPAKESVIGIQVLASKETPGLGDKIEKDPRFLENFISLDTRLAFDKTSLMNEIEFVKFGKKSNPWQVEGITGATISSKAIARMLRESGESWIPLINRHLSQLKNQNQPQDQMHVE